MTLADLFERFGPMPLARIRTDPSPGTATEDDFLAVDPQREPLCELISGILVEKTMGVKESALAFWIGVLLGAQVLSRKLGLMLGADGPVRLRCGQIRFPDVSFVSQQRLQESGWQGEPILPCAPNLAVEVLSAGNTPREIEQKLGENFSAGVESTWIIDPQTRLVRVDRSPDEFVELRAGEQ